MLTRTVRAETMLEALEQIKEEMGSDALIVSARQVPGGPSWAVWKKPVVEVVAVKPDSAEKAESKPAATAKNGGKSRKKSEPAADQSKETTGKHVDAKPTPEPAPAPVAEYEKEEKIEESVEDTSPLQVNVRKAVFPELKKEKPAARLLEKNHANAAPFELMERLGILGEEAESRPEIEMTFSEKFTPEPEFKPAPAPVALKVLEEPPATALSVEKFADLIAPPVSTRPEDMWPLLAKLYQQLKTQGLEEEILNRVTDVCLEMVSSKGMNDEKRVRDSLAKQLEAYVHTQKDNASAQQIICLVGASGAGKTSLCAKLAVRYHNSQKKRVAWVSTDTVRTGAINEAKTYADAIGIPLHTAYTPGELYEAVATEKIADVILVDMPAVNPRSESSVTELGSYLTVLQRRTAWMVAPATAKSTDLINLAATLAPFHLKGIALTKLDETNTFGSVFNLAWKSQLPLIYYAFGPRVMDELSTARADALVRAMFTERFDG